MGEPEIPDGVPLGMEVEYWADTHDMPLMPWQRRVLLQMMPKPAGEEQPKVKFVLFRRRR